MPLRRYINNTLDAPIAMIRRRAIAIAVCVVGAVGALCYFAAAAVVALEAPVGPALARVIVGGAFLLIAIGAILVPSLFRKEGLVERAQEEAQSMTREEKIALIIEALLAGFSMSSRRSRGKSAS